MLDSRRLELAGFVLLFAFVGYSFATSSVAIDDGLNRTELEYEIHDEVNERRQQQGMDNLSFNDDLREVARYHSRDMTYRDYVSHTGPDGESVSDRYQQFALDCTGGENIHFNPEYGSSESEVAKSVVSAWMESQGHRENILRSEYNTEGIGVHTEDGDLAVTQNFC